jgi:hypothetical protein
MRLGCQSCAFVFVLACANVCGFSQTSRRLPSSNSVTQAKSSTIKDNEIVRSFIERAQGFSDLEVKVNTLVRLGSLLWQEKGQQDLARQLFLHLNDDLTTASSNQSELDRSRGTRPPIARLQQILLLFLARHDAKLARQLLIEQVRGGASDPQFPARSLDLAEALAKDGSTSDAQTFAEQAIGADFTKLNLISILALLHDLRLRDSSSADSLFLKVLGQLATQSHVTADDILLVGTYLFNSDAEANTGSMHNTPVMIGGLYFAAGISDERVGLSANIVRAYLVTALSLLNRELESANDEPKRRRYEAVARMLELKAEKFAPDLVDPFGAVARSFVGSAVDPYARSEQESGSKPLDYDVASKEIDNIPTSQARDERWLGLIATAYSQNDLEAASKMANRLDDLEQRTRLKELIEFRRANTFIEKGDPVQATAAESKVNSLELRIILELGLAGLELKAKASDAAWKRLQALLIDILGHEFEARGLYLLRVAALLEKVKPKIALQTLLDATKAFDASSAGVSEISRRDHLTKIQIGKKTAVFSVNSKAVSLGDFNKPLLEIFTESPEDTIAIISSMKNEKVLGPALVAIADQVAAKGSAQTATN